MGEVSVWHVFPLTQESIQRLYHHIGGSGAALIRIAFYPFGKSHGDADMKVFGLLLMVVIAICLGLHNQPFSLLSLLQPHKRRLPGIGAGLLILP